MLGEEEEKFLRFEVAAERSEVKNRVEQTEEQPVCDDMTHCQEHEHEEPEEQKEERLRRTSQLDEFFRRINRWQEKEERTIRRECIEGGVKEERDFASKRTRPSAAHCGGIRRKRWLTLSGNSDAGGMAAVRAVQ